MPQAVPLVAAVVAVLVLPSDLPSAAARAQGLADGATADLLHLAPTAWACSPSSPC